MGSFIMGYLFIGLMVGLAVGQLLLSARAQGWPIPVWVAVSLYLLIMLAFILVPIDVRASISPFTHHR